jgi:hypothetical protein
MLEDNVSRSFVVLAAEEKACRKVGQFIAKGGCFALHDAEGPDVWLEIDPIPLHLIDEEVEIVGQHFGPELVQVMAIRPTKGWA